MKITLSGKITEFYYTVIIEGVTLYYQVRWKSGRYDVPSYSTGKWQIEILKWQPGLTEHTIHGEWEPVFYSNSHKKRPGNNDSYNELQAFLENQLSNLKKKYR